jgi:hypothetical protein
LIATDNLMTAPKGEIPFKDIKASLLALDTKKVTASISPLASPLKKSLQKSSSLRDLNQLLPAISNGGSIAEQVSPPHNPLHEKFARQRSTSWGKL